MGLVHFLDPGDWICLPNSHRPRELHGGVFDCRGYHGFEPAPDPARFLSKSYIDSLGGQNSTERLSTMANQSKQENFFEGSVWVLFLILGVIEILFGLGDMVAGIENDPAILLSATGRTTAELKAQDPLIYNTMDQQQKVIGHALLMTGLLVSVISLTAFRRGARWAWFAFWLIPIDLALIVVSSYNNRQPGESLAPPFYSGLLFAVLTTLWLALSHGKYLSREGE